MYFFKYMYIYTFFFSFLYSGFDKMLSNIFVRSLISNRPIYNCQQYVLGLLSRSKSMSIENHSNNREVGIVKRFSKDKGYGFITKTNDGIDYFVQYVDFIVLEFNP